MMISSIDAIHCMNENLHQQMYSTGSVLVVLALATNKLDSGYILGISHPLIESIIYLHYLKLLFCCSLTHSREVFNWGLEFVKQAVEVL